VSISFLTRALRIISEKSNLPDECPPQTPIDIGLWWF